MLELENLNVESPELTSPSPGRIKGFFCALLRPRRFPLLVAALGVALTLPSLSAGLAFDDYHAKLCLQGSDSPVRLMDSPLDLFRFCKGPQHLARIMDFGFFPWWTCGNIKAAFWRPLASLTHWVDYTLWPETPALMHLHSILWYAGAVAVVALLYRRLMGATVAAGLAAVLYAVDDAHGMVVGFLSNRSDLPAVVFGVLCLIAHDRWRRRRWRLGAGLGPVLLLVSLLFKEAAIATCAYLAAYELFLRHGRRPGRLWALAPYAVVVLAWRLCWSGLGYGLAEIAPYVDPVTEPWRFAFAVLERAPALLLGQWALPPSEITGAVARGKPVISLVAVAFLLLVALVLLPLLRRDRVARFWAAGMMLSIVPACAVFPMDRMLMFPGVGAMALVGRYLVLVGAELRRQTRVFPRRLPARALAWLLVVVHLIIAPLALPVRAVWFMGPPWLREALRPAGPMDPSITGQDLIIVNPPEAFFVMETPLIWAAEGNPMPRHLRILMSSRLRPVAVHRIDAHTLAVRPEAGFLNGIVDPLFRGRDRPLLLGQQVELPGMTVEVTELTADNRPAEATFRFAVPLEDASLRWLKWEDGSFVPFDPPAVGEKVELPSS